eukprot:CAMPEP_0197056276 /NCGR_PEP_ID=MMETSP1384-20130603/81689_1 /TAXON_ID=29189 /ORGANISM="Ammonia sp." /LENGTH=362 /DNA_ID=CAMNT_0042490191 /DNA_START=17 /DNA_END=1102 /DNA_ORIENTATION=-
MDTSAFSELRTDGNCSICLCEKATDLAAISCCKHTFHEECIKSWSQITNKCPFCKLRFSYISRLSADAEIIRVEDKEQKLNRDDLSIDYIENESYWQSQTCQVCHGADPADDHLAMICDGCNNVYHTFCIGLECVPSDLLWFCQHCHHLRQDPEDINSSDVRFKDDLSEYDSNEELQDNAFTKDDSSSDEEWVPCTPATNHAAKMSEFASISKHTRIRSKSKKSRSRKQASIKKKKRTLKRLWSEQECALCLTTFADECTLKLHTQIEHASDTKLANQAKPVFDTVGDVITDSQRCNVNEQTTQTANRRKRGKTANDDGSKLQCKRRKLSGCHDVLHAEFHGRTSKQEGCEIVKDTVGESMW